MVSVEIRALGKLKETYLQEAVLEYRKRLGRFCQVSENELAPVLLPEGPSEKEIAAALAKEASLLLGKADAKICTIALCVEGKPLSSPAFSAFLQAQMARGKSGFRFLVGSSYGMAEQVKQQADLRLSFSPMTFPHQLMRVLLYEQIYRAFSIKEHGKYHK